MYDRDYCNHIDHTRSYYFYFSGFYILVEVVIALVVVPVLLHQNLITDILITGSLISALPVQFMKNE